MGYRVPGPCTVTWAGSAAIGSYVDGVVIRPRTEWVPIGDQQHGNVPADFVFAGKACTVEIAGVAPSLIAAASPWISTLLGHGIADIGKLLADEALFCAALVITESGGANVWSADLAVPLDPEFRLSSTQELRLPMIWAILPDTAGKLFQILPGYLT